MFKKIKKLTLMAALATVVSLPGKAQDVGFKTNLLYDATLTVNLGLEVGLAPKWTFDLSGNFNAWYVDSQTWKHWMLQPELRFWFCDRFAGHFIGAHAIGGQFNFGKLKYTYDFLGNNFSQLQNYRYQGWGFGAGIAYGYSWILGNHWNLEAEVGIGWIRSWYDIYDCTDCSRKIASDRQRDYYGPTKAAISLVYVF